MFFHRGRRNETAQPDGITRIWQVNPPPVARRYVIRRDHPLVVMLRDRLGGSAEVLDAFIELAERTVPVDRIWLDTVENGPPPAPGGDSIGYSPLIDSARGIVRSMMAAGLDRAAAVAAVARMEPFDSVPDIANRLTES